VRWGREKRSRAVEEEDRRVTAYHEAGHALVSALTPNLDPVHKVTIVSRGMALGLTMSLPERDDFYMRRTKLLGMIAMCYGGRVAEELVFDDVSAGAANDIEQATRFAKMMVCEFGMSEAVGPVKYTLDQESPFLGREFHLGADISEQTMELIHREIRKILETQYERARALVRTHRAKLDAIAQGLLRHETLTGEEVAAVVRGDDLEEFRAARERDRLQKEHEAHERAAAASRSKTSGSLADAGDGIADARGLAPS
jgi:cell division protease FtsH